MLDREKIIKGLERCLICDISVVASEEAQNAHHECEYTVGLYCGQKKLLRDALELLKGQEAVEPKHNPLSPTDWFCGKCGMCISRFHDYCPSCGQAVKWE